MVGNMLYTSLSDYLLNPGATVTAHCRAEEVSVVPKLTFIVMTGQELRVLTPPQTGLGPGQAEGIA